MATNDVPGAVAAHKDTLHIGCWAEHADGSLIFVKGVEGGRVVYEIYDLAGTEPVVYSDAMQEAAFKKVFSFPPVGTSAEKWTWHDKTEFPWDRVMKSVQRPVPAMMAEQTLSAAQRVADSLKLRAERLHAESLRHHTTETVQRRGSAVLAKVARALDVLMQ